MSRRDLLLTCLVLTAVGIGLAHRMPSALRNDVETRVRARFLAEHPHEKPLNWAIGKVVEKFYQSQPMGRFVLHKNDCSDFVECVIDEALGVGARFKRGSDAHRIGVRDEVFDSRSWEPGQVVQPGDVVSVRHSPWYTPYQGAIWHVGVVGTDGKVYDFTKLRRWQQARYGRHEFAWFIRHSRDYGSVIISRLKPEYRYMVKPLPQ